MSTGNSNFISGPPMFNPQMPMSNFNPFTDPMMSSTGTPMMTTMAPTGLPAQGKVPTGFGSEPFLRDQLHQAHWRESQSQAQINLLLQQQANLLSHPPQSTTSTSPPSTTPTPPAHIPEPPSTQAPPPTPCQGSTPASPLALDPTAVASQIMAGDEEWINTVRLCLKDSTRTLAANGIFDKDRPKLATSTTKQVKETFIRAAKNLDPSIPESKIQSLIRVLGASYLLDETDLDSMFTVDLINTNKRAMVIPLSHIARFKEKEPFKGKADNSWAMVHGTNIIGARNALAEALVRPADWTYCEHLHKSELPTYGCYSLGASITSRKGEIPRWNLVDLLDRAVKRGKGIFGFTVQRSW
eukprot:s3867_g7.t1